VFELVLATRNKGKKREIVDLLSDLPFKILSLDDIPNAPEVVENGKTFRDNAIKKAVEIAKFTGRLTIADDSGIEVDALKGAPGVYSARFASPKATDSDNNDKLLELMKDVPDDLRGASYRCAIAVATPDGLVDVVEASCEGRIGRALKGFHGFGYDPLFVRLEYGKTFAELDPSIKNRISHRAKALERARLVLERIPSYRNDVV
jgi:XTP/dITP diphosphohydrolase